MLPLYGGPILMFKILVEIMQLVTEEIVKNCIVDELYSSLPTLNQEPVTT